MDTGDSIGITTPLTKTDRLRRGDYIYEINPDSNLPFEKVMYVLAVNDNLVELIDICSNEKKNINLSNDYLSNLQKLQIPDNVRKTIGID